MGHSGSYREDLGGGYYSVFRIHDSLFLWLPFFVASDMTIALEETTQRG